MTILRTERVHRPRGLQVQNRLGERVDVPAIADSFITNLGDMMMRWTNDRWVSTPHRVLNPPRDVAIASRRMSIPFFHEPNFDTVIECLPSCCSALNPAKYPPVTVGRYVYERLMMVLADEERAKAAASMSAT